MLHPDLDSLKTILYRAIQEVAWCKVGIVEDDIKMLSVSAVIMATCSDVQGLYLDTGLYLNKIGQLYCTTRKQVTYPDHEEEEEEELEPKYEEIPGTLEHVTELMVEKDLRLRLPLQELDVLLEPVL